MTSGSRRVVGWVAVVVLVGVAGVVGWWAGRTAVAPPEVVESSDAVAYEVGVDSVSRVLRFQGSAVWPLTDGPLSRAAGVVTSVAIDVGDTVDAGNVLYAVDLRPVVVAEGDTPMFRSLALRAEGPDVAQLQSMLATLGFFDGEADGVFGATTGTAVRAWQTSLGVEPDGVVQAGDVVFARELPLVVVPSETVAVGASVSGGEEAFRVVPEAPRFWVPLSPDQRSLVPSDVPVQVEHPGGIWDAVVVDVVEDPERFNLEYVLGGPDGGPVCGGACLDAVPLTGQTDFPVFFVVVPETTGPMVPVAAVHTGPGGEASVTMASGEVRPVTVLAGFGGMVIVDGIEPGELVLVTELDGTEGVG
jgi:peptidoglycan hydrolase-like protein with peptidoglycan-binding domain